MDGGFGNNVGIETVTEIDRIDVVTADIVLSAFVNKDRGN